MNTLYYGDNRDILPRYVKDESVDLIYLDPPFKSNQDYNVLFAEQSGVKSAAQIMAFEDTWHWNEESAKWFEQVVMRNDKVSDLLIAFRRFLGDNDMMAYLANMAPCLVELRRVLKPTGSIYLHCDPTASHYLKLLMDAVFGAVNFRNEIVWRRTGAHNSARRFGPIHDNVLFYRSSSEYKWKGHKRPYMRKHVEENFVRDEDGWRTNYYGNVLTGSGVRKGESGMVWRGFNPTAKNRHWAIPKVLYQDLEEDIASLSVLEKLERLHELGLIKIAQGQAWPIYEHRITAGDGQPTPDIWAFQPYTEGTVFDRGNDYGIDQDVKWLSPQDKERLGYPTQKPEGLLERIIKASSNEGDVVLDPFCGCGTAVAVAQKLNRKWLGIDITHLAITLIKKRLRDSFGDEIEKNYKVFGEPVDLEGAMALAEQDKYQFQWWALGLVGARPEEQKKGADRGIDGRRTFFEGKDRHPEQILISVKGGNTNSAHVRDLRGTMEREKAALGLFITLNAPTREMTKEAAAAGFYDSEYSQSKHPKLQILTIEKLLEGHRPDLPPLARTGWSDATFKKAPKAKKGHKGNTELDL